MPSAYYDLEIGADGALKATPIQADGSGTVPPDVAALLTKVHGVFDRARLQIPAGPARSVFLQHVLDVGRMGLRDGNLAFTKEQLERLELSEADGHVQYYAVTLDEAETLHVSAPPWAPNPMPEEVTLLLARIDKAIHKVRRLILTADKRSQYLHMLLSYAKRALEQGDLKNASGVLDQFEKQFVEEEGPAFRAKYVASTLRTALYLLVGISFLAILYGSARWALPENKLPEYLLQVVPTVLAVAFGICLGVSFFAFVRNLELTFDQLGNFDPANLSPVLRFSLVGIIAIILCVLLSAKLVKLDIGTVEFADYLNDRLTAIILGMVCGYSDAAITRTLAGVLERK